MNTRIVFVGVMVGLITTASLIYRFSTNSQDGIQIIGIVDANEVVISSKIPGRISFLKVEEGDDVVAGELIARIEVDDLMAERDAATATARQRDQQLRQARESALETAGQTEAQIASAKAQLENARAALSQTEATWERQHNDTVRTVKLSNAGVMSEQARDQATTTLKELGAAVAAARENVAVAEAALKLAIEKTREVTQSKFTVAAAASTAVAAAADVRHASVNEGYSLVSTPIAGKVGTRAALQGEIVAAGTPIITVVNLAQTWVYAPVPESYADSVLLGDNLRIVMPSGTQVFGKVIAKFAEGDFATQRDVSRRKRDIKTIRIKLLISNKGYRFVPGMTAEVYLPLHK